MVDFDDSSLDDPPAPPSAPVRYRAPVGMPLRDEGRRAGVVVSVIVHALVIGLLIVPFFMPSSVIERMQQGAGGPGPAGGGGGGSRGTGGSNVEALRYVRLAPDPIATPTTLPAIPPPPVPKVEPPKPPAEPAPKVPETQAAVPAPQTVASAVTGAGGGSGRDGTAGMGPGSGGGVGSGIGTGQGSANGAGTGGGTQANYPPQPIEFFLPPLPPPSSVRGFRFIAEFDVDSTGRVMDFKFTETRDGDYNRRIASVLRSMRFRPGTRPNGTPLRMKAQVGYEF